MNKQFLHRIMSSYSYRYIVYNGGWWYQPQTILFRRHGLETDMGQRQKGDNSYSSQNLLAYFIHKKWEISNPKFPAIKVSHSLHSTYPLGKNVWKVEFCISFIKPNIRQIRWKMIWNVNTRIQIPSSWTFHHATHLHSPVTMVFVFLLQEGRNI